MEDENLIPYFSNEKILADLCHQLSKDISVEGFEVNVIYPSKTVFEQLYNQIFPLIQALQKENKSKLNFILNRTDISETQLKRALEINKEKTYPQLVSELIIKRELQKVVIRNMQR